MHLSSLLSGAEWDELSQAFADKRPVLRPAAVPGRFDALWSDWELDAFCRCTLLLGSDTFRLLKQGKQVPAATFLDRRGAPSLATLRQLWNSGVSVNFAQLEQFSNPVLALVRGLEAAWRTPTRVHFFTTPGESQALSAHADHSDVLVLQVAGEKTWDVYLAAPRWQPGQPHTTEHLRDYPPETITLKAGGWLYLPRGVFHEVRNQAAVPSTHFTLGLQPLSWAELLRRALELGGGSLPALAETALVAGPLPNSEDDIARRLQGLRPLLEGALHADRYGVPLPPAALPARAVVDAVDAATRFAWAREEVRVRTIGQRAELNLSYRSQPLTLRAEFVPALELMVGREVFAPADLPGDAETAVLLCRFLANAGVLRFAA